MCELYRLVYSFAHLEKPTSLVLSGKALGLGGVLGYLGVFSLATPNTVIGFPETGFGSVPSGGASYVLSRLPGSLGLYLALTGRPLTGSDAVHLGFAYDYVLDPEQAKTELATFCQHSDFFRNTKELYGDRWKEIITNRQTNEYEENVQDGRELRHRTNTGDYWTEHRENLRMVGADILYKRTLKGLAREQYREFAGQPIANHLEKARESVADSIEKGPLWPLSLKEDISAIHRVFSAGSLEECWERLAAETHREEDAEWAKGTLKVLLDKSPLALAAAFTLIKRAQGLGWAECLNLEYNTLRNLAGHEDFRGGVGSKLPRNKENFEWTVNFPVSSDQLEELTSINKELNVESVDCEIAPVKEWYSEYPHGPRM